MEAFLLIKPNGILNYFHLDLSISVLRVVGWYFQFYSNLNRTICKQTMKTLIRRGILWRLILVCTVCLCSTKRTLDLYGLRLRITNCDTAVRQMPGLRVHPDFFV